MNVESVIKFFGLDRQQQVKPVLQLSVLEDGDNFTIIDGMPEKITHPYLLSPDAPSNEPVGKCTGKFQCNLNGVTYKLVAYGTKLYTYESNTLTIIFSGLNSEAFLNFNVFDNKCIICNGVNTPIEFDGNIAQSITFTDDASPIWNNAKPKYSFTKGGRIYYLGNTLSNKQNLVLTPRPGTHNNFNNTESTVDAFYVQGNGIITGGMAFSKDLAVIYMTDSCIGLQGSQPFSDIASDPHRLTPISMEIGCLSPRSIIQAGNNQYFLSKRGLENLQAVQEYGDVKIIDLYDRIKNTVSEFLKSYSYNNDNYSVYDHLNGKIYTHFIKSDNTILRIGYDINTGDLEKANFNTFFTNAAIFDHYIYYGDDNAGLYECKTFNYDHESFIETHWYYTKYGSGVLKNWNRLLIEVETDTELSNLDIQATYYIRGAQRDNPRVITKSIASGALYDEANYDEAYYDQAGNALIVINNLGKSNGIKINITSKANEHYRIKRMELFYTPLGITKG